MVWIKILLTVLDSRSTCFSDAVLPRLWIKVTKNSFLDYMISKNYDIAKFFIQKKKCWLFHFCWRITASCSISYLFIIFKNKRNSILFIFWNIQLRKECLLNEISLWFFLWNIFLLTDIYLSFSEHVEGMESTFTNFSFTSST